MVVVLVMRLIELLLLEHHLHSKGLCNIKHIVTNNSPIEVGIGLSWLLLTSLGLPLRCAVLVQETLATFLQDYYDTLVICSISILLRGLGLQRRFFDFCGASFVFIFIRRRS
jgi:hypothetical protein